MAEQSAVAWLLGWRAVVRGEWLQLEDQDWSWIRESHIDRRATSELIRYGFEHGRLSLESLTDYHLATGSRPGLSPFVTLAFQRDRTHRKWIGGNDAVLQLFGRLSGEQRKMALGGTGRFKLSQLTGQLRNRLTTLVRQSHMPFTPKPIDVPWGSMRRVSDDEVVPVYVIGAQLPIDSVVSIFVERSSALLPAQPLNRFTTITLGDTGMEAIARGIVFQELRGSISESDIDFGRLMLSPISRVVLQVEVPGLGFFRESVRVNEAPFDLKPEPWSSLPPETLKELEKHIQEQRERYKDVTFGNRGKRIPPP
ncbi:MAG: hypothetical protein IIC73_04980 [Armatimonadetes bacterium]|nr:hypothetical protein [Armatimonadota bacterium]